MLGGGTACLIDKEESTSETLSMAACQLPAYNPKPMARLSSGERRWFSASPKTRAVFSNMDLAQ